MAKAVKSLTPSGRRSKKAIERLTEFDSDVMVRRMAKGKKNPEITLGWWYEQGYTVGRNDSKVSMGIDSDKSARNEFVFMWDNVERYWGGKPDEKDSAWNMFELGYRNGYNGHPLSKKFAKLTGKKLKHVSEKAPRKQNPDSEAAAGYEMFHGKPSEFVEVVEERLHWHKNLWEVGKLVEIKVTTPFGKQVTLTAPDPSQRKKAVLLTANEKCNQLYFTGGDQSICLQDIGFTKKDHHDIVLVGSIDEITYRTKKDFDEFKTLDYFHGLGEVTGVQPVLTYDTRAKRMSVAGGQYTIEKEGIKN
jgi:hypothetical protein